MGGEDQKRVAWGKRRGCVRRALTTQLRETQSTGSGSSHTKRSEALRSYRLEAGLTGGERGSWRGWGRGTERILSLPARCS